VQRIEAAASGGRYDVALGDLARGDGGDDQARAIIGHLARAGVIQPAPSTPDRARGRVLAPFDGRARTMCKAFAGEAQNARWRQYRSIWKFVESRQCRREALLRHFGDQSEPSPRVPCCDVCAGDVLVPEVPIAVRRAPARGATGVAADLDEAILSVVSDAQPGVGRTRTVEILRGGRSKVVQKYAYDGLPAYGAFSHLRGEEVLARVDELVAEGRLQSTGGTYPKLELAPAAV
jgi:ATP-dependent DNA helicase RecQ